MQNLSVVNKEPRVIDPNSPLDKQKAALESLIQNPPENSRIICFSPPLAGWVLQNLNSNNRQIRPARIRRFANDLANKRWYLTGDTIKFGRSGLLRDGQNRLQACIHSELNLKTHVVFGVDDRAFAVMDTGAVRTGVDAFKIDGVPHPRIAAPAVRWLIIHEQNPADPNRGMSIDNATLLQYLREMVDRPRLDQAVKRAIAAGRMFSPGYLAALLYIFDGTDARAAARFSADLEAQAHGVRRLVEAMKELRKQQMGRLHELQAQAMIIKAFNAYRRSQSVTKASVKWTDAQPFPVV